MQSLVNGASRANADLEVNRLAELIEEEARAYDKQSERLGKGITAEAYRICASVLREAVTEVRLVKARTADDLLDRIETMERWQAERLANPPRPRAISSGPRPLPE